MGTRTDGRTLLGRQPARLLMIDLASPFTSEIGQDVCKALENMFSVACNISGPPRIPFFGLMALYRYPELFLPFSYVRNNFPRIQTAICDIRGMLENLNSVDQSAAIIEQGLIDACNQYNRQLQSTPQSGGFSHQLEIILLTCQSGTRLQKIVETTAANLEVENLKRIQIVSISSLGSLMDNLSQTSLSSDHSSTNSIGGMVEVTNIEPDFLCLQNFFNGWLLDSSTDSEHLHLILPPADRDDELTVLKCDLHERLLHPAHLPHYGQFLLIFYLQTVHSDTASLKMIFPSPSKAVGMTVPVYKLQVTNTIPISSICDSIIFGLPMVVTATSCWKVDWDDLERNQQMFKALCHTLASKDQALIAYLHPQDTCQKQTSTSHYEPTNQPLGKFVLLPALDGTLLIKSIAVQELMLPCQAGNHTEEPSDERLNTIAESLDKLECLETYNPLNQPSNLYSCLKNSHKKPAPKQKRQLDTAYSEWTSTSSSGKMSRKSCPPPPSYSKGYNSGTSRTNQQTAVDKRPGAIGASRTVLKESNQQHQQRLYQSFDDYDFGDSDENNNAVTYRSGQFSKKKPVHSFPTSL